MAVGSDDADDFISTNMINSVINPDDAKDTSDDGEMSEKEVKQVMEKMTPRAR